MLRKQRLAKKEDKYLLLSLQEPLRLKTACCSLRASTLNPKFCISPANGHVCFTPNSRHVQCKRAMSALGQKRTSSSHSITSSAREISVAGTVMPRILVVWALMDNSKLVT